MNRAYGSLRTWIVLMILLILTLFIPQQAKAGPLNLEEGIQYLYDAAKERGVVATTWDWNGTKSVALALKYAVFHNEAKTRHYAALLFGGDVTVEPKPEGRYLVTPSLNLIDISKSIWERRSISKHLTVNSGPKGWEFWVGPYIRPPVQKWGEWTWRSHTGILVSIGKRLGPDPKADPEK